MNIQETTAYLVEDRLFRVREEAIKFIEDYEKNEKFYALNLEKLEGRKGLVPIQYSNQHYNNPSFVHLNEGEYPYGDGLLWRDILDNGDLRNLGSEIKVLTPGEFMAGFEKGNYHLDGNNFRYWINGVAEMNSLAGEVLTLKEFAEKIGETEISPF